MLSPAQLLEARKKTPPIIPSMGEKSNSNTVDDNNYSQLETYLLNRETLLHATRIKMKGAISKGVWHVDKSKAEIEEIIGNSLMNKGHSINSKIYLYPEEALYLIDIGSLELFYEGVPMSLQKAYNILLNNTGVTLNQYRVYSHLSVLGNKVTRFSDSEFTNKNSCTKTNEVSNSSETDIPIKIDECFDDNQILKRLRDVGPEKADYHSNNINGDFVLSHPNRKKHEFCIDSDDNLIIRVFSKDDPVPDMKEMSNWKSDGKAIPVLFAVVHPDFISFFLSCAVDIPIIM